MKYCGIGGQAVLEGIMMRNRNRYAVAVRKSDGTIETTVEELHPFSEKHRWAAFPFIRGFVSLIESLKTGMKTLMWSASFEEDENGDVYLATIEDDEEFDRIADIFDDSFNDFDYDEGEEE